MPLHPSCRRFLEHGRAVAEWRDIARMTPPKARALGVVDSPMRPRTVAAVEDVEIPGPAGAIRLRLYRPRTESPAGILVWLHGGGYVLGSLDVADPECRALAVASGALVVSVEYRLAPEHPFPAGLDDCCAAVDWVERNRGRLAGEGARIAVGGESAGGALAACVAQLARDRGGPDIAFQVLVHMMACRDGAAFPARRELASGYWPTEEAIQWCWDRYLGGNADSSGPGAAPLPADALGGLPPALVVTAEYDPLRDEGEHYAQRLREAGVEAVIQRVPGIVHGLFAWVDDVPAATESLRAIGAALAAALGAPLAPAAGGSAEDRS